MKPLGVEVAFGKAVAAPLKNPLPLSFSKTIIKNRYLHDKEDATVLTTNTIITTDPPVITIQMEPQNGETNESTTTPVDTPNFMNQTTPTVYNLVETADGAFLMPVNLVQDSTKTTDAVLVPVTSSNVQISDKIDDPVVVPQKVAETNSENTTSETRKPPKMKKTIPKVVLKRLNDREIRSSVRAVEHCKCCRILRSFRVHTQTKMTDFFKGASYTKSCPCTSREYPKITNKLKILLNNFKNESGANWTRLYSKAGRNMKAVRFILLLATQTTERYTYACTNKYTRMHTFKHQKLAQHMLVFSGTCECCAWFDAHAFTCRSMVFFLPSL